MTSSSTPVGDTASPLIPRPDQLRKAVIGAAIGSVVEWYDVAVYGYLAVVIGKVFFAATDSTTALLSSFAVFGSAFLVRPLGGTFFGTLGDRIGRKHTLAWVILMVSISTVAIGLLPGYASIGVAAPVLLVVLRLLQGFSAGGELSGAAVFVAEYAPARRRGYYVSWVEVGAILGFLIGSVAVLVLNVSISDAQLLDWGWRIPFLLAAPLGVVGLYIRTRLEETPEFEAMRQRRQVAKNPLRETLVNHWPSILRAAGFSLYHNAALYVILTFIPTYLSKTLGYSSTLASLSSVVCISAICIVIPVMGAASDRLGRRPLLAASCVLSLLMSYPLFILMGQHAPALAVVAQLGLGVILAIFLGTTMAASSEQFSTQVRYSGFSIGYNLSVSAFGGTAPFLVTLLVTGTGLIAAPAFYIMAAALVTLAVVAKTKETAPLKTNPISARRGHHAVTVTPSRDAQ